jgi:hypothetical protein
MNYLLSSNSEIKNFKLQTKNSKLITIFAKFDLAKRDKNLSI